ncbi:MAG: PAS domain S-box protein [Thermodesulfovibrionales bacterium]
MKKPENQQEKDKETTKSSTTKLIKEITRAEGIISAIGDGISILDRTFTILYENKIHSDLMGTHAGEFCYKAYAKRQGICGGCPVAISFKDGKAHTVQRELQTDKEIRYAEITASALKDSTGKIIAGIEVVRDITERKKMVKLTDNALTFNKTIFEASPIGIITYKASGQCVSVNESIAKMVGATVDQLLKQNYYHLESWKKSGMLEVAEEALATGIEKRKDVHIVSTFGKEVWFACRFVPFQFENEPHLLALFTDITERKRAEEKLSESEKRFKDIFDNASDGILLSDPETKRFYLGNKTICEKLGYSEEEIKNLGLQDIHPEKDLPYVTEQFEKQTRKEITLASDIPIKRKNGSFFYADINSFPITIAGKQYIAGIFRDITDRKQADEELKKSERILSSSFAALDGLLVILDKDFRVVKSNWKDHDFVPEEVRSGHPYCYEVFKQLQSPCDYCPPRDTFKDGKFRIYEDKNPVDGSYKEVSVSPVLDETGKVTMVIQHVRDITERKRSEQVLKETEQKLRNIIEHSNELYYVHDTNQVLSYVSPQSLQVLGYTPDEMMIEWTRLTTDNPTNEKGIEITLEALKTGVKQPPYFLELFKKDRSKVLLEIDESPLKDEQGNVIGMVGAARDVTERVKAEEALKKSEKHIHMLLDSTAEGIYGIDLEGNCTFVNAACLRILGYDDENELIGKNMHDLIHYKHPDGSPYPAEECKIFQAHKENKRIHDDTEVFWHKDGSSFPVEYRAFPIEEQGAMIGAVITFLDITERRKEKELEDMRTEQKLLNKEALLHLMKTNIQDPDELWKFMTLMGSQILGVDRVSIWFINNMRSAFICEALYILTKHSYEKGLKIQVKHCPQYAAVLSESRILTIEKVLADKRTIELSEDYLMPFGIISKMDVPVLRLGEVIGIISFEHTKERGWTYEDQDFAISLSHIITASLENFDRTTAERSLRNSEKELKKRVKELEEFYEMAVGRELRIRDLKEEVEELKEELGKYKK